MKYSLIMVVVCLIPHSNCFGQSDSSSTRFFATTPLKTDTSFIKSYSDVFTFRLVSINKSNKFSIDLNQSNNSIKYKPNSQWNLGFGINYKWLGFDLAFSLPFLNKDDAILGPTKRLDLQTNIYLRKLIVDVFFQFYKGYHVSNPQNIIPGWKPGDAIPINPNMKSYSLGGSVIYVFNNREFSYKAAFNLNERQKKRAGSFILGAGIFNITLKNDSGFVSSNSFPELPVNVTDFDKAVLGSLYFEGGYAYTFVYNNWYASLSLAIGGGLSSIKTRELLSGDARKTNAFSFIVDFRGSMGYNGDIWYGGFSFFTGNFFVNNRENLNINFGLSNIRFFVGYRFYRLVENIQNRKK